MPSQSLVMWRTVAARALDEMEAAHRAVGGTGRGRRYATQQINHAYAVLLSSQFQRFCRDLQSEAADDLGGAVGSPDLRDIFRSQLTTGRRLDAGNPNPGNIGSDFGRLGMDFWPEVLALDPSNARRRASLEVLNRWRNAIAHQDFDPSQLGGRVDIRLADVRRWRATCNALARQFDSAVARHLATILNAALWQS
jgi:hypothetical protein